MFKNFDKVYIFKGRVAMSPIYTFRNSSASLMGLKEN